MKPQFHCAISAVLAMFFFSIAAHNPVLASTAEAGSKPAKVKKHRVKVAKRQNEGAQYLYGSSETQLMRDKRLSRECKGAANGGACRGYTQ